jgi:hypothetical protein
MLHYTMPKIQVKNFTDPTLSMTEYDIGRIRFNVAENTNKTYIIYDMTL